MGTESMYKKNIGPIVRQTAKFIGLAKTIKPTLFIIGAQKCGTTYLFNFLNQQKDICSSSNKEFDFFSTNHFYNKGEKWYLDYFIFRRKHKITFEATVNYLYYPKSYQRIFKYNPKSKLIILLRNPTSRAYSSWNMYKEMWTNNKDHIIKTYFNILDNPQRKEGLHFINQKKYPSFNQSILEEIDIFHKKGYTNHEPGFIFRGIYYNQIKELLSIFNKNQILFIENNELKDTNRLSKTIENFLQTPITPNDIDQSLKFKGIYQNPINEEDQLILDNFYKPLNEQLFHLLDKEFDWI